MEQLWGGIGAVFKSWNGKRAISYRRIEGIPDEWGTAVNVQSMVFGNMGDTLGHRRGLHPQPGHRREQVLRRVAGQRPGRGRGGRHPHAQPAERRDEERAERAPAVAREGHGPSSTRSSHDIRDKLEKHYHDMQDIEFTIQDGKLYMLQCRSGKRTGTAALNMAMDMLDEELIDEKTAVTRVEPGPARRAAAPDRRSRGREDGEAVRQGPAGRSGRRLRRDRLHLRRRRGLGQKAGKTCHPGPRRDQPRGRRRHARGRGHPHRPRRHDQPRGPGRPRLGQVLHRRRRRPRRSTPRAKNDDRRRQDASRRAT